MNLQERVNDKIYRDLKTLVTLKTQGKRIGAFGAAAKGITYLNCLGIKSNIIDFIIDETPSKIGMFAPGSRIPILPISYLDTAKPDILLILAWNFKDEIVKKTLFIQKWGGEHLCLT